MPVMHIVQYFRRPLWAVEVDDSHFGGHCFYRGAAARVISVGLHDFLTEVLTRWKFPTFCSILGLDLRANGFHTLYGHTFHIVLTWKCVHVYMVFLADCIPFHVLLGCEREAPHVSWMSYACIWQDAFCVNRWDTSQVTLHGRPVQGLMYSSHLQHKAAGVLGYESTVQGRGVVMRMS